MPAIHRAGVLLAAVAIAATASWLDSARADDATEPEPVIASGATGKAPLCGAVVVAAKSSAIDDGEREGQAPRQLEAIQALQPVVHGPVVESGQPVPGPEFDLTAVRYTISRALRKPVKIVAIEAAADVDDFLEDGSLESGGNEGVDLLDGSDLLDEQLDWGDEQSDWSGVSAETDGSEWYEMSSVKCGKLPCPSFHDGCQCQDCCDVAYPYLGCLGYLLVPSDPCLADFISPMTNPVFFEDPRSLTEVRGIFLNNTVPDDAGGGQVRLFALQARAALSDCLSVIATKSGYISSSNPVIEDGWADLTAGVKYNVVSDSCTGHLFALGATYEFAVGSPQTFQDTGDGRINTFVSGGTRIGTRFHWLSAAGYRMPIDTSIDAQSLYWSNHVDFQLSECVYLLAECNWYHWTKSGSGGIDGLEGLDLFNFGSTGVVGKDIATGAFGIKLKPHRHLELGVAWETPMTDERDIIDNRLTVDCILRY